MKKLSVCVMALILAGCTVIPAVPIPDDMSQQFQRDKFDCAVQARTYYRIPPSQDAIGVGDIAEQVDKMYRTCMESRGYAEQ